MLYRILTWWGYLSSAAPIKRTAVERQVNVQIVYLFILLLLLSIGSTIGSSIRTWFLSSAQWYLVETDTLSARGGFFHFIVHVSAADRVVSNVAKTFIEG